MLFAIKRSIDAENNLRECIHMDFAYELWKHDIWESYLSIFTHLFDQAKTCKISILSGLPLARGFVAQKAIEWALGGGRLRKHKLHVISIVSQSVALYLELLTELKWSDSLQVLFYFRPNVSRERRLELIGWLVGWLVGMKQKFSLVFGLTACWA